ncbi:MAG: hypothetical protein V7727_00440 [Sneathiella sp.]
MEKYTAWDPIKGLLDTFYVESIHDDYEGFRILLQGDDKTTDVLRIKFDVALAYRKVDEGDRWKTVSSNPELQKSVFFIVENSNWIDWFCNESCGIHSSDELIHYAIFTSNDCIDVLSAVEPSVEWL